MKQISIFLTVFAAASQASAGLLPWIAPAKPALSSVKISQLPVIPYQVPVLLSIPGEVRVPLPKSPKSPCRKPAAPVDTVIHLPSTRVPMDIAPGSWKFPGQHIPSKPEPKVWAHIFDNAAGETPAPVVVPEPAPIKKPASEAPAPRPEKKPHTLPEFDLEQEIGIR